MAQGFELLAKPIGRQSNAHEEEDARHGSIAARKCAISKKKPKDRQDENDY
jgi:hypothetical protein